jgi:hypothetical protein
MSPYTGKVYDNDALRILQQAMNMAWGELRASDHWATCRTDQGVARDTHLPNGSSGSQPRGSAILTSSRPRRSVRISGEGGHDGRR